MRPAVVLVVALVSLLVLPAVASADEVQVIAIRADEAPTIDGFLDDPVWQNAVWYEFVEGEHAVENGVWNEGYHVRWAVAYDDEYFYFAGDVTDSVLITNQFDDNIWQDDCFEVWFDWMSLEVCCGTGFYQWGLAPWSVFDEPAVWVWRTETAFEGMDVIQATVLESNMTDEGWTVEARVDLSAFVGADPLPESIGFNVSMVDRNVPGAGGDANWVHITWHGDLHNDPSQFVPLVFQ